MCSRVEARWRVTETDLYADTNATVTGTDRVPVAVIDKTTSKELPCAR
jgi:hypothetical protein